MFTNKYWLVLWRFVCNLVTTMLHQSSVTPKMINNYYDGHAWIKEIVGFMNSTRMRAWATASQLGTESECHCNSHTEPNHVRKWFYRGTLAYEHTTAGLNFVPPTLVRSSAYIHSTQLTSQMIEEGSNRMLRCQHSIAAAKRFNSTNLSVTTLSGLWQCHTTCASSFTVD